MIKIQHFPMAKTKKKARDEAECVLVRNFPQPPPKKPAIPPLTSFQIIKWIPSATSTTTSPAQYCITKRPSSGLLGGLWALPATPLPADDTSPTSRKQLSTTLITHLFGAAILEPAASSTHTHRITDRTFHESSISHTFTHIAMRYFVEESIIAGGEAPPNVRADGVEWRWLGLDEACKIVSTGFKKVLLSSTMATTTAAAAPRKPTKRTAAVKRKRPLAD